MVKDALRIATSETEQPGLYYYDNKGVGSCFSQHRMYGAS